MPRRLHPSLAVCLLSSTALFAVGCGSDGASNSSPSTEDSRPGDSTTATQSDDSTSDDSTSEDSTGSTPSWVVFREKPERGGYEIAFPARPTTGEWGDPEFDEPPEWYATFDTLSGLEYESSFAAADGDGTPAELMESTIESYREEDVLRRAELTEIDVPRAVAADLKIEFPGEDEGTTSYIACRTVVTPKGTYTLNVIRSDRFPTDEEVKPFIDSFRVVE